MSEVEPVNALMIELSGNVAYSFINESVPIAYLSQQPQCTFLARNVVHPDDAWMTPFDTDRFPYTSQTYKSPQSVWLFV